MKRIPGFKYFTLIFFAIYFSGCEIKDFVSPSWDLNANLPILQEVYSIFDILGSSPNYFIDSVDNSVVFKVDFDDLNDLKNSLYVDGYNSSNNLFNLNTDTTLYLTFDDSNFVRYAEVREGEISITLFNSASSQYSFNLSILNLRNILTGEVLKFQGTVNPNSNAELSSSLAGYSVDNNGQLSNKLTFRIITTSSANIISSFNYTISSTRFNIVSGRFKPTLTRDIIDTISKPLGTNSPTMPLELSIVKNSYLTIRNYSEADMKLSNIRLLGINQFANTSQYLLFDYDNNGFKDSSFVFHLPGKGSMQYSEIILQLTEFNSNIKQFIGNMPSEIYYFRDLLVNENYGDIDVSYLDSIVTDFVADIPMKFRSSHYSKFLDTSFSSFSQKQKEEIVNSQGANLTVNIVNSIPLDLKIKIFLQDDQSNVLMVLTNNITNQPADSFAYLPAATVDANGEVIPGGESILSIPVNLSYEEIQNIRDFTKVVIEFNYKSENGVEIVRVRANDFLRLKVAGELKIRVNS